jgi:hypothetical protein
MSPAASVAEHPDKFGPLAPITVVVDVTGWIEAAMT